MYEIHFRRWFDTVDDYAVCAKFNCLAESANYRLVSGELVVHAGTNHVVVDQCWLFPWERTDENSYARRAIQHEIKRRKQEAELPN